MTNLDSILKSRDLILPTKVCLVEAIVFPVVMYGCESWTVKKTEHQKIDAFELWCWRRLLRVPWTARRSNQSIPGEISPGCSLEGLMLKLKLQYSGHFTFTSNEVTHWKRPWCWEGLGAGGEGDDRGWDGWMASPTQWTWVWVNSRSWWWTGRPGVLWFTGSQRVGHDRSTKLNWVVHCMYVCLCVYVCVPHLYSFICWWIHRLLPYPGNCKQSCNESLEFMCLFKLVFCGFQRYIPRSGKLSHMLVLFLSFWEIFILFSTVVAPIYIPTNSIWGFPFFHIFVNICCFLFWW